jgi:hypothetical protein
MCTKRLVMIVALLTLVVSPVVFASGAAAQSGAPAAAEVCRQLDEAGVLDRPNNQLTRGECVNLLKGRSSPQANNFIAADCGQAETQEFAQTTNKGQCIKTVRALLGS